MQSPGDQDPCRAAGSSSGRGHVICVYQHFIDAYAIIRSSRKALCADAPAYAQAVCQEEETVCLDLSLSHIAAGPEEPLPQRRCRVLL